MDVGTSTGVTSAADPGTSAFEALAVSAMKELRPAIVALVGPDRADDLLADTMVVAWEQRQRVTEAGNPMGYLFVIARNLARKRSRRDLFFPAVDPVSSPAVEPALPAALAALSEQQRVTVFLIAGCGWKHREVAELLHISMSSVSTHYERALDTLRQHLGASHD